MIEIRRIWRHTGEENAIHLMLSSNVLSDTGERAERHIKLKRSANPAMYDFISEYAAVIPSDNRPEADQKTKSE
jgi:hypothetical protein